MRMSAEQLKYPRSPRETLMTRIQTGNWRCHVAHDRSKIDANASGEQQAGQAAAPSATGNASTGHGSFNPPAAASAAASPTTTVSTASRPLRRKLPPLPRSDLKIVLRPKKGLAIIEYSTHLISRAIAAACEPHPHCTGSDFIARIRPGSNIIIVSTPHEETARVLRRVDTLTLGGKNYEFNTYVPAPEGTLRGVIHGIEPGTPSEELLANLRVRTQGVKVHSARMLGNSNTAVITFDGTMIPRYVLFYGGEVACHPYKATRQVCKAEDGRVSATEVNSACQTTASPTAGSPSSTASPEGVPGEKKHNIRSDSTKGSSVDKDNRR
ncbi:hypothetical protein MTO96_044438 [Rhipicephalus appendiculatus]